MTDTVNVPREATDGLIDGFAAALKSKLNKAAEKYGYNDDWMRPEWREDLVRHLIAHVEKGDPRDVAAYCAFAWHHGWSVKPEAPKVEQEPVRWEAYVTTALGSEWVIADKGHKHDYFKSLGLPMRPLYNHPAPSSDELLKQLEWEEIGQLVGRATPEIGTEYAIQEFSVWEYRYQLTIREADDAKTKTSYHHRLDDAKAAAQDDFKRRVSACIAKHKGPQS